MTENNIHKAMHLQTNKKNTHFFFYIVCGIDISLTNWFYSRSLCFCTTTNSRNNNNRERQREREEKKRTQTSSFNQCSTSHIKEKKNCIHENTS